MVNTVKIIEPLVKGAAKLAGLTPRLVEIEPGTLLNIWLPKKDTNKPVVVFLHSFAANGILTWLFQVLSLSNTYSVYVFDLLFFSDSVTEKSDRTTDFQAECVANGLRKIGVEKCTIVGLSYGGIVGFKMARNYPDLVESMVVSGTVIELTESITVASLAKIGADSWPELLLPDSVDGLKKQLTVVTHKFPWWIPTFAFRHFLEVMFDNKKERVELLKALVISDTDAAVPNYTQRIHLLWGDDDKIFNSKVAQDMKEKLGDKASLEFIERAGHLSQLERPFLFNQKLKKALASFQTEDKQKS